METLNDFWNLLAVVLIETNCDYLWISTHILSVNRHKIWNNICNEFGAVVANIGDWGFLFVVPFDFLWVKYCFQGAKSDTKHFFYVK